MTDVANDETIKYRLFAAYTDKQSLAAAENIRFSRITGKYCLFYPSNSEMTNLPEKMTELSDADASTLPKDDLAWLAECNETIIAEYIAAHKEQEEKYFQQFVEEYDAALAAELAAKQSEDDTNGRRLS